MGAGRDERGAERPHPRCHAPLSAGREGLLGTDASAHEGRGCGRRVSCRAMAVLLAAAVVLRPLRESEIPALARALVETSEAQIENRWREQALGYRELLVAELDPSKIGRAS